MALTYFKRFRMEVDIGDWLAAPELPFGYHWVPWNDSLVGVHAEVQFRSFSHELDSSVFPCLGDRYGCLRLLRETRRKDGFLPAATWLIGCGPELCGTIQGVLDVGGIGSIQNVGVVSEHRGMRLGRALVLKCLEGFRDAGASRVFLEVTADNAGAINVYREVGFRKAKIVYKASDV